MSKVYLHIGLQKTGTTFIQKNIFPHLKSINVVNGTESFLNLIRANNTQHNKILITNENIVGRLRGGSYLEDFYRNLTNLELLLGTDLNIIIGFRQHDKFLSSAYRQMLYSGYSKSLDSVYNPNNTGLLKDRDLNFTVRIKYLESKFSNVFVYTTESLKSNLEGFLAGLTSFLNVKEAIPIQIIQAKKNRTQGINSEFQLNTLKKINIFNDKVMIPYLKTSLNNRQFKRLKITPGHIFRPSQVFDGYSNGKKV